MNTLTTVLHDGALATGVGATVCTGTVAVVALVSVLARSEQRRCDARETLKVLLRRGTQTETH